MKIKEMIIKSEEFKILQKQVEAIVAAKLDYKDRNMDSCDLRFTISGDARILLDLTLPTDDVGARLKDGFLASLDSELQSLEEQKNALEV